MNEEIKLRRRAKLTDTMKATIDHLERGLSTLESANLYTTDDQEHEIDTFATRLKDILNEMRDMVNGI